MKNKCSHSFTEISEPNFDTRAYHYYTIIEIYLSQYCPYQRGTEMILTCTGLFQIKYKQMRKIFISLCKNPTLVYNLYILRIVTPVYHIFIKRELYSLAYNKNTGLVY